MKRKSRLSWWIAGGVSVAAVAAVALFPQLQERRAQSAVAAARGFLAKNDFGSAAISIQRALDLQPDSIDALQIKASILHRLRDPDAINLLARVAEKTGERTHLLSALATAIQFNETARVAKIADAVRARWPNDPQALRVLSSYAITADRLDDARQFLAQLGALDPNNGYDQFNRASLDLSAAEAARRTAAEARLRALARHPELGAPALRLLIQLDASRKDFAAAAADSDALIKNPGSTLLDRFEHFRWQSRVDAAAAARSFAALLQLHMTDEQNLQLLLRLTAWQHFAEAEQIVPRLSREFAATHRAVIARADLYSRERKLDALDAVLADPALPKNDPFIELWLARAARERGQMARAQQHLSAALRLATAHASVESALAATLETWGWTEEAMIFHWRQALGNSAPAPALARLARHYDETGNTAQLVAVMERWLAVDPQSVAAKNNLALGYLLLDTRTTRAHDLAFNAASTAPTNATYRSTYAFSLLRQEKPQAARAELAKIPAPPPPQDALYHALVFAANNEPSPARAAVALVNPSRLLPEERKLLEQLNGRLR